MGLAPNSPPSDCRKDNTIYVEVLVILAVVTMFLLNALGSLRRRTSDSRLHGIVEGAYTLSYTLVSYTIGRMQSSGWYYQDFAVWSVFLLLLLGSTDNLTVCCLNDIDNWKSIYVQTLLKGFFLVSIFVDITYIEAHAHHSSFPYLHPLYPILLVVVLKWYVRIASMRTVSKSYRGKNVKVMVEYMEYKDNNLVPFDPVTMQGYSYMVAGDKYCVDRPQHTPWYNWDGLSLKVTTVEQIWRCTGRLLATEHGKRLKDLCLSMALSKMLNRRFAGFKLSEAKLEKTHDLVFKGLLAEGHQRAFRVIEEELVFVHDMYFTRYYYLYQKGRYLALPLPLIMIALYSWLTCLLLKHYEHPSLPATIGITVVLGFLEAYQLYLYIASGWFKVALIRSYINTPFCQKSGCFLEAIMGVVLRLKAFRPWKGSLGQYNLLRDLGRKSKIRNCLHYATLRLVGKASKKGRENSVKLPESVKKAIVDSLQGSNGHLTNGVTSLQKNGVHDHLSWACDATATDGAVTRTILVWHIATTLCEQKLDAQFKQEDAVKTATILSQYCLHLIAFAPNLLPDHGSISESILDRSINEADMLLKEAKNKEIEDRCEILMEVIPRDRGGDDTGPVAKGVRLARHLIDDIQDSTIRWKVLSDFWAEMMLYVSPSDNAQAHLEVLARGGEFITHLWALLTHAGVLKRGPEDVV